MLKAAVMAKYNSTPEATEETYNYYDLLLGSHMFSPEKRLLAAVLYRMVWDLDVYLGRAPEKRSCYAYDQALDAYNFLKQEGDYAYQKENRTNGYTITLPNIVSFLFSQHDSETVLEFLHKKYPAPPPPPLVKRIEKLDMRKPENRKLKESRKVESSVYSSAEGVPRRELDWSNNHATSSGDSSLTGCSP